VAQYTFQNIGYHQNEYHSPEYEICRDAEMNTEKYFCSCIYRKHFVYNFILTLLPVVTFNLLIVVIKQHWPALGITTGALTRPGCPENKLVKNWQ